MENNFFDNNSETEVLQPVEQPVEAQPAEKTFNFADVANSVADKAKDMVANKGSFMDKIKAIPKKVWILAGAAIAALIVVCVVFSILSNTPSAPINAAEDVLNAKSVTKMIDKVPSVLNGFGESEAKKIIKILKKSDQYADIIEDAEDAYAEMREELEDEYGKNFKIKFKVTEKEELEKEDNKIFRDQLRRIADLGEQLEDMDSDDYEDMADTLGITKSQAKDMVKALESFCKDCKKAKVTKGYELTVVASITGSEVDEPDENELTIRVFKVDGRWVPDVFSLVEGFGGMSGIGGLAGIGGFAQPEIAYPGYSYGY